MKSEIIGRGMFAKAFKNSKSDNCIFFCSGVSKSTEKELKEFEREKSLLSRTIENADNKCIVYFSSILAADESNDYYSHKKKMEDLVASKSNRYLIMRLPQVAGSVTNETLLPNFVKNIYLGNQFDIYNDAPRTIIDIDDVVLLFDLLYGDGKINQTIIQCPSYTFQPIELVRIISEKLMVEASYRIVERKSTQHCEPCQTAKKYQYIYGDVNTYLERVVNKYLNDIVRKLIELAP